MAIKKISWSMTLIDTLHSKKHASFSRVIVALLSIFFISHHTVLAEPDSIHAKVDALIDTGGYCLTRNGKVINTLNPDNLYIPASILKIATALAALDILGPDFRFETAFYQDDQHNLFIKGMGDPFLVSEEIALIFDTLKDQNVHRINNIYLDVSTFRLTTAPPGIGASLNPYDAVNGALAVNFNTVHIVVDATGEVRSAEPQTPFLPLMLEVGKTLTPGTHRINISRTPSDILRHTGELFRAFQYEKGIAGEGIIAEKSLPHGVDLVYLHRSSKNLQSILGPLLLYSNNFIANQIFLACGVKQLGSPATWEKAKNALDLFLQKKLNLQGQDIQFVEGSGISRKNRITPRAMITILEAFKPYIHLMPFEKGRWVKSGTLKGVYSYAGYFTKNGRVDSFVLIMNQRKNNRDQVLNLLDSLYRQSFNQTSSPLSLTP